MRFLHIQAWRFALVGLFCASPTLVQAQMDPVFTYQGQLKEAGRPYNGTAYLEFSLWDAPELGTQIGKPYWTSDGVNVVNGLFTAEVDAMLFGPTAFNGEPRWLQVVLTDWNYYDRIELSPRQAINPAPYALYALDGAGGSGVSVWQTNGSDVYYSNGNVGIGVDEPDAKLDVAGTGKMTGFQLTKTPVAGYVLTSDSMGHGTWQPPSGGGDSLWQMGEESILFNGGSVGIGLGEGIWPQATLDVGGIVKATGFKIGNTATPGYVLTTNAQGVGTWQPAGGGFWGSDAAGINYTSGNVGIGASSTSEDLLRLHGTGTRAIRARNGATTGTTYGVEGSADSTSGRGVYGYAPSSSGQAVGVLGETASLDGYGVWGYNDADEGHMNAVGVYGSSNSPSGIGVKGHVYGPGGSALWGRNEGTSGHALLAEATAVSGSTFGVEAYAVSPDGYGVYAFNEAESGNAVAIYGETASPTGFAGYFDGRGYFKDGVGIGTTTTSSKLTVNGMIESATNGFKFPDGTVQATAATGGGSSLWQTNGSEIYYIAGNVGIGVVDSHSPLHVAGGNWDVANTEGDFKIGNSTYRLKMGVATDGAGAGSCRIFAGGPSSKLTLGASGQDRLTVTSTSVGVGTTTPTAALDVNGTFRVRTGATAGYVLTSDSSGYATWQPGGSGGSFDLPFSGSVAETGSVFKITNTGTFMGSAISGIIQNATSSDASAGYFKAEGSGYAVYASNDGGSATMRVRHSGATGDAIYAITEGHVGGYFKSSGTVGVGVEAEGKRYGVEARATGTVTGTAVRAEATGTDSTGLYATSPHNAAVFNGNVVVYSYTGAGEVFAVNNDGTTQVDVLQIMGGADLSERFDVLTDETQAEPGMVVCIDPENPGKLVVSDKAYDRTVAGIISGAGGIKTGMMMGQSESVADGAYPVALTGRVYAWADASAGPIEPGDMLTTSDVPGHAMKVTDHSRAHGATLGKAMTSLDSGRGLVLVLVSLQ